MTDQTPLHRDINTQNRRWHHASGGFAVWRDEGSLCPAKVRTGDLRCSRELAQFVRDR